MAEANPGGAAAAVTADQVAEELCGAAGVLAIDPLPVGIGGEVVSGSLITAATSVGADPPIGVSKADKETVIIERQGQQVRS
jgi:hypothetical protein